MGMSQEAGPETAREQTATLYDLIEVRLVSMGDIAEEIGIQPSTLSNWCNGKKRPDPLPAQRLARVLGITLDEFYDAYDRGAAARAARTGDSAEMPAAAKAAD